MLPVPVSLLRPAAVATPFLVLTLALGLTGCVDGGGGDSTARVENQDTEDGDTGSGGDDAAGSEDGGSSENPAAGSLTLGSGTGEAFVAGGLALGIADGEKLDFDGSTEVTATVRRDGEPAGEVTIGFSSTCQADDEAAFSAENVTTDPQGTATTTYSVTGCTGTDTITASTKGASSDATAEVEIATRTLGAGTGEDFAKGELALGIADGEKLAFNGSTAVEATVRRDGEPASEVAVAFSSPCAATGKARFSEAVSTTGPDGIARTTYTAAGCEDSDTISASAEGVSRDATASVSIADPALGSLAFVAAEPTHIGLQGMAQEVGEVRQSSTGTVRFRLRDASGEALAGVPVSFELPTSVGGLSLSHDSAVTDSNGEVTTTVQAGTVATPVRVTATAGGSNGIRSQSEQLWVGTGLPVGEDLTLVADILNPRIGRCMGETVELTAFARDRFGHPVPDGTAILFSPEAGTIVESACQTQDGSCSVTWRSQLPVEGDRATLDNARATILAYAIGEEGFIDHDGDGRFGSAEASAGSSAWTDTGEPFRDDDEDGSFTPGTDGFFYDYDEDGQRTGANGQFDGVLCDADDGTCGTAYAAIGKPLTLVLSGDRVRFDTPPPGSHSVSNDGDLTIALSYEASDGSSQPLPADTTLVLELPEGFSVGEAERTMPSTNTSGTWSHTFELGAEDSAEADKATIRVTIPGNDCYAAETVTRRFTLKP